MNTRVLVRWIVSLVIVIGAIGAIGLALNPAAQARAAKTIDWPGSVSPCDTPSLQKCVDGVQLGDVIHIKPGVYTQSITLARAVSLVGDNSQTTILNAEPSQRVLTVTGNITSSTIIFGLAFAHGSGNPVPPTCREACGGGILISGAARPTLQNITLAQNSSGQGGGLWIDAGPAARLINVAFISNTVNGLDAFGGGAYINGSVQLDGGRFVGNSVSGGEVPNGGGLYAMGMSANGTQFLGNTANGSLSSGGGIYLSSGPSELLGVTLIGNRSTFGGAIFAGGTLSLSDGVVLNNTAGSEGGGIYDSSGNLAITGGKYVGNAARLGGAFYTSGPLTLIAAEVSHNSATDGGGVYATQPVVVDHSKFFDNQAAVTTGRGGALYAANTLDLNSTALVSNSAAYGGGVYHDVSGDARVVNTVFVRNQALNGLGAALNLNSTGNVIVLHTTIGDPISNTGHAIEAANGTLGITDTIIVSHATAINAVNAIVFENYNLFFGNTVNRVGGITGGGNDRTGVDPQFADPLNDDYHLRFASPAINNGANAGVAVDFDGQPRPIGPGFDIGFDESGTSIQQLIDATSPGGTVLIPSGSYRESLTLYKPVNLIGAGSGATVINAIAGDRVLTVTGPITPSTQIANLTLSGGNVVGGGFDRAGGGVLITGTAYPAFNNVNIIGNSADFGGGLYVYQGSAIMNNSLMVGNSATQYGGGIYAGNTVYVTGTRFFDNAAYDGSALEITGTAQARIVNAFIAENPTFGALPSTNSSVRFDSSGSSSILHTTFGNATQPMTRAVAINNGNVTIVNTIIATYTNGLGRFGGTVNEDYNLYFHTGITVSGSINQGGHSLVGLDPLFKNPVAGDYHLNGQSPAVNRGTNVGVRRDIDLDPRPLGGGFDIGADEASVASTNADPGVGGDFTYTTAQNSTIKLDIPPGAVTQTTPIYCSLLNTSTLQPPRRLMFAGVVFELDANPDPVNGSPGSISFNVPVTLSVSYTDAELASAGITDELSLKLYRFEPLLNDWRPIGYRPGETQTLDTKNKVIIATLLGFSRIGKMGSTTEYDIFLPLIAKN